MKHYTNCPECQAWDVNGHDPACPFVGCWPIMDSNSPKSLEDLLDELIQEARQYQKEGMFTAWRGNAEIHKQEVGRIRAEIIAGWSPTWAERPEAKGCKPCPDCGQPLTPFCANAQCKRNTHADGPNVISDAVLVRDGLTEKATREDKWAAIAALERILTPAPSQPQEGGPFHPDTCPTHPMTRRVCPLCQPQEAGADKRLACPECTGYNGPVSAECSVCDAQGWISPDHPRADQSPGPFTGTCANHWEPDHSWDQPFEPAPSLDEAKAESGERSDPAPICPDHNLPYNATDAKGCYLCPKCPAAPSQAVPIEVDRAFHLAELEAIRAEMCPDHCESRLRNSDKHGPYCRVISKAIAYFEGAAPHAGGLASQRGIAESEAKAHAAFWGENPPGDTRPAPDFTTICQCQNVVGAWEFCQRMKAEHPGTAKAASADTYLRRTFATLQSDIAKCVAGGPEPQAHAGGREPGNLDGSGKGGANA